MGYHHYTRLVFLKSSFYPFGMEIVSLSSYAAIKLPNDRDYQGNELEEEFGLELHHFDARMYDGQVGRFQGMDPLADQQMTLTPYHQSANNPVMFVDPDGRLFFLAAGLIMTAFKVKLKIGALAKAGISALSNIVANKKSIAKAADGGRNSFWKGFGMALGYGAVGALGSAVGGGKSGLLSFMVGGSANLTFEGVTGQFEGKGVNPLGRMAGSFLTGGFTALAGKNFGKMMDKGSDLGLEASGFKTKANIPEGLLSKEESLDLKQALAKEKAKKALLGGRQIGNFALAGAENVGGKLNEYKGNLSLMQLGVFFGAGALSKFLSTGITGLGFDNLPVLGRGSAVSFGLTSIAAPLAGYGVADFSANVINHYGAKGKWPKKINDVYSNGLKSLYKIDFYESASFWGFSSTFRAFRGM